MKLILLLVASISVFFYLSDQEQVVVSASPIEPSKVDQLVVLNNESAPMSAEAFGVFDIETGELLLSKNGDKLLPVASVTKLFTAKAVLERARLDGVLEVTPDDVATEGRAGRLEAGQLYTARELLFPLLLESSNDAATALGRVVGEIKIGDRPVADPSGLSASNQSSVAELATLVTDLYQFEPYILDITRLKTYVGENTTWSNNSPVVNMAGYVGGKHGFTTEARQTLVALFKEEGLDSRTLGYVILGSSNLRADIVALRGWVDDSVTLQ